MNFIHLEYWPALLLAFLVFSAVILLLEKRFFVVIKTYWFADRSLFSRLSTFLFLGSIALLLLSLLDLRGPEEKIKAEVPTERTIILIDTSASMLAEDVKPSRLQKAVLIAKHFARKASGHQISIVAFAEIQKKIVPFTNDLDLIDSRLDSIKNLRNQYGSSALTVAIQESIQYFRDTGGEARGNLLVLTDGEETSKGLSFKVPENIYVALVGIGTSQGGRIPLDDDRGFRFGYKKDRGQDVITKLDEKFFKTAVSDIPSSKYWIANSYTLPSDEILDFFRSEKMKGQGQQDMIIRPVMMEWLVVPALILMLVSQFLKAIRIFTLGLVLVLSPLVWGQDEEPELSAELVERLSKLQEGRLNRLERIKLADDLREAGLKNEALTLYSENINPKELDPSLPPEAYLNYGTGLLEKGDTQEGLSVYKELLEKLPDSERKDQMRKMIDQNVVTHFQQQEQKKKEKEQKDKENKKNEKQEGQSGQSGQSGDKGQQSSQKNNSEKDDQDQEKKEQGQDKSDSDDKNSDQDENENEKKNQPRDPKESELARKRKIPAKLKQLMSDDRQLQMKMIEQGTRDLNRRKSRESKDW